MARKKLGFWGEFGIAMAILIIIAGVTVAIILLQPTSSNPTPTPTPPVTVTFIPPQVVQTVSITTRLSDDTVVCIAFDDAAQLRYGNCGDTTIQGGWTYDDVLGIAVNNVSSTSKSNCLINPQSIVNPTIFGQPVNASTRLCQHISLNPVTGLISGIDSDNQTVYIGFIGTRLAWVPTVEHAQEFTISF